MPTLILLRHAKSSWDEPGLDDHERPLAPRGTRAATAIGRFMARKDLRPDLILCSGAVRTRATVALVLPEIGAEGVKVVCDDALYLATPTVLLDRIRRIPDDVAQAMIVGHNPGLHALALELTGAGSRRDIAQLATKFPTAGLAWLTFPLARWGAVGPAGGRLDGFMSPKRLS
jgi:phosphohistidine phosphatase